MRLFLYTWYFIRSVYYRGLAKTVRLIKAEPFYENYFNIDTGSIKASEDPDNFHYQGAGYLVLLDLFKKLPLESRSTSFIDYGCGKGRALFCAEYSGFNDLIGVELDEELLKTAEQNLKSYSKKRAGSRFTFIHQNALDFKIPQGAGVFYFFNPFSENVMKKVIDAIKSYHAATKNKIYVVYVNPKYNTLWMDSGFRVLHQEKTARYTEAFIYTL
jgi:tRNA1(Val) A37 N6-methylase TrmN6